MHISYQQLNDLPVETESGEKLGHIADLEINVDNNEIIKYLISNKRLMIETKTYLIAPSQIISITNDKVIVEDNVEKEMAKDTFSVKQVVTNKEAPSLNSEIK